MSKIAIITIGWSKFALPPKVDAAKILQALSSAEAVSSVGYGRNVVWFPTPEDELSRGALTLEYVDSRKMRPSKPRDLDDDDGQTLRLKG
ncbi:hypothetical protein [Actomonas aquatica]|uniref:Uncharacterized protein n=1 Tax=Actomonas aquatica TaxID=2866162 RepID=A0ABZ1CD87_9BACT|nr:hypothetical protein [Opitutus sp. WL0086]WRQ89371.1 hypothetical protein K1X11_008115 [Opitutus sp. WL0086]